MSTAQDQKLTPEDAYNVLVSQVHAPVFFNKLARDFGIQPQNEQEAQELLVMAGRLRNAHEQVGQKQASERTSFLKEAREDLDAVLQQQGIQPLYGSDAEVKAAAADAVQNPLIKEAALVFNEALTQALNG